MTDAATLLQYQNLRLQQFQQIIIALNNERTQLHSQLVASKNSPTSTSIEDLIQFDEKSEHNVEELNKQLEQLKSDFNEEKNRLCEEIKNATELLEEERKKSGLLVLENNTLKEKLNSLELSIKDGSYRDSGLSDNDSDRNSRFRPNKFRKKSRSGKSLKEESNYNNPNDPENINEVLQSLAREKLKTASLTEQVENLQLM